MKLLMEDWRKYLTEDITLDIKVNKKDFTIRDAYVAFVLNASMQGNISPRTLLSPDNQNLLKHIKDYNHRKDEVSDEELYNYITS